jgi:hypothetical protein
MSRNMPMVRRMWIHPGAVVVKVTNAQITSITMAAIIPKSMGKSRVKFVDLECDDRYVQGVINAAVAEQKNGIIVGAENSLFEPTSPSSGSDKLR